MKMLHEVPEAKEYMEIRMLAGLVLKDETSAQTALSGSVFSVTVRNSDDAKLIGMGRIVGDGACYVQLVDLIVHPDYVDQGVNDIIIHELLGFLDHNIPKDANVIVMADVSSIQYYQKHGFQLVYPDLYGMSRNSLQE